MFTVKEIAHKTGVSVRTLHHYDAIGLLKPSSLTDAGYRLYDEEAVHRLRLILLLRELQFTLPQICEILNAPDAERNQLLEQQIQILEHKRMQLDNRITFARGLQQIGVKYMNLEGYQANTLDDQVEQARTLWGKTEAWKQYEEKSAGRSKQQSNQIAQGLMDLFRQLGQHRPPSADCPEAQTWVQQLRDYITANFYDCTPQILQGLGQMYAGGGSMTENIDKAGGAGTAEFACQAITFYCQKF